VDDAAGVRGGKGLREMLAQDERLGHRPAPGALDELDQRLRAQLHAQARPTFRKPLHGVRHQHGGVVAKRLQSGDLAAHRAEGAPIERLGIDLERESRVVAHPGVHLGDGAPPHRYQLVVVRGHRGLPGFQPHRVHTVREVRVWHAGCGA
jgi:hypothetical protein